MLLRRPRDDGGFLGSSATASQVAALREKGHSDYLGLCRRLTPSETLVIGKAEQD